MPPGLAWRRWITGIWGKNMKKILLIGTGGTIASEVSDSGLAPELTTEQLLSHIPAISDICEVDCVQLLSLDSTNITPAHWLKMVRCIREHYDGYDGFVLTGETDGGVDVGRLTEELTDRFYALEMRDRTTVRRDIWDGCGEDSLRGLFLRELRAKWDAAGSEEERETVTRAARFGLAALDHRDLG